MRKRVSTKSPVRENCTPGSVRGLSGNWQSYRDPSEAQRITRKAFAESVRAQFLAVRREMFTALEPRLFFKVPEERHRRIFRS
jgi:hypothetical protein